MLLDFFRNSLYNYKISSYVRRKSERDGIALLDKVLDNIEKSIQIGVVKRLKTPVKQTGARRIIS
jgi:hypothetical protein